VHNIYIDFCTFCRYVRWYIPPLRTKIDIVSLAKR